MTQRFGNFQGPNNTKYLNYDGDPTSGDVWFDHANSSVKVSDGGSTWKELMSGLGTAEIPGGDEYAPLLTITVGTGGDYSTLSDAFDFLNDNKLANGQSLDLSTEEFPGKPIVAVEILSSQTLSQSLTLNNLTAKIYIGYASQNQSAVINGNNNVIVVNNSDVVFADAYEFRNLSILAKQSAKVNLSRVFFNSDQFSNVSVYGESSSSIEIFTNKVKLLDMKTNSKAVIETGVTLQDVRMETGAIVSGGSGITCPDIIVEAGCILSPFDIDLTGSPASIRVENGALVNCAGDIDNGTIRIPGGTVVCRDYSNVTIDVESGDSSTSTTKGSGKVIVTDVSPTGDSIIQMCANIPTTEPSDPGILWKDSNDFVKISASPS